MDPPAWLLLGGIILTLLLFLAAIAVSLVLLFTLPWRFPAALGQWWPVYALVAVHRLPWLLAARLGWSWLPPRDDVARPLTARAWLRQRLDALGCGQVELVVPTSGLQRTSDRYTAPGKTILLSSKLHNARGAAAYAHAARALARLLILEDRRGLGALPRLTAAAQRGSSAAGALLVGATVVDLAALRLIAMALLFTFALVQIAGLAFERITTATAARQLRADPQLEGPAAELAVRHLKRHAAAEGAYALAFLAVALLAPSIVATVLAAAPAPSLPAAAPLLTGTGLALAKLSAILCVLGCTGSLVWPRAHPLVAPPFMAFSLVTTFAVPTLVALTWDQPFVAAHRWTMALGIASSFPVLVGLALMVPMLVGRFALLRLWREPNLPAESEDPAERAPAAARRAAPSPAAPPQAPAIAAVTFLWSTLVTCLPLPLAFLTLRALW